MKVNIEITEGCTNFSYLINNKEWVEYACNESTKEDTEFLDKVHEKLIDEAQEQYQLPNWIIEYLWDGDYETCCQQGTVINLVKVNKNTTEECLGTCDECGDTVYRWKLEIDIKD